jgi:hydrogenase maturation protease
LFPPVLVLGLGNALLGDDGVGLTLLAELSKQSGWGDAVEFLDGGTQGVALLGRISRRAHLLILDAVGVGAQAGTVHVLGTSKVAQISGARASSSHEANAGELLTAATLLGESPGEVVVVGVEPLSVEIGMGLSEPVQKAVPAALEHARRVTNEMLQATGGPACV